MARIVIIGAGLTGLSAAYHLEQAGFFDYVLIEKESSVGGLCRSVFKDGFTFDYTGHLLHASDPYFASLLKNVVGLENFVSVIRRSFVYSHNVYTRYPFQMNLFGLPPSVIVDCLTGFVQRPIIKKPKMFKEWAETSFGKGIAHHFFLPFQSKLFACSLNEITASWTGRFVPSTSFERLVLGAVSDVVESSVGYNAQFLYPRRGGIQFWIDQLANRLILKPKLNCAVESIDLQKKHIMLSSGAIEPYEHLISTMPLPQLLRSLVRNLDANTLRKALPYLRANHVVNFNIGVNRPDLSDKHWIYFPEKQYPFYRIGFPHNFTPEVVPPGCSSLYGEFSHCGATERVVNNRLKTSREAVKKLLNFNERDIVMEEIIRIDYAYVLYDLWREKNLSSLLVKLKQSSVNSIGRYGAWKYASMQEAVLDGKQIANELVSSLTFNKERMSNAGIVL